MPRADEQVPVLVPMAGWDPDHPLDEWLGDRLFTDYPGAFRRRDDVRKLLAEHRVMPVLDGLDEMPETRRHQALRQIDATVSLGPRMVITCRNAEFQEAVDRAGVLSRAAVITIDPVRPVDTIRYLTQREAADSSRWQPVIAALRAEPDGPLAAALSTPLMISLCRQVFRGAADTPELLTALPSRAAIEHHILQAFLPSIYPDGSDMVKAERRLTFLACHLSYRLNTTTLAWWQIANAVPSWVLATLCGLLSVLLPLVLFIGFVATDRGFEMALWAVAPVAEVLSFWLPIVVVIAANTRRLQVPTVPRGLLCLLMDLLLRAARDAGTVMLVAGLIRVVMALTGLGSVFDASLRSWVVMSVLASQEWVYLPAAIAVTVMLSVASGAMTADSAGRPRRFAGTWGRLIPELAHGLTVGLAAGAVVGLLAVLLGGEDGLFIGAFAVVVLAVGIGAPVALTGWLQTPVGGDEPSSPVSSLRADRRATLAAASVASLALGVMLASLTVLLIDEGSGWGALPVETALTMVPLLPVAAFASGSSWLTFLAARAWLGLTGRLPWRLMAFLEDAHRRGVFRQTGTTYQFRHARLQDELATHGTDRPKVRPKAGPVARLRRFEHVWSVLIFLLGFAVLYLVNRRIFAY